MKSATIEDVKSVYYSGTVPQNIMFRTPIGLAHVVHLFYTDYGSFPLGYFMFERHDGKEFGLIHYSNLREVEKKQGSSSAKNNPPKPKKPHIKGSRPFVYDASKIKVGTKVKCRDGKVRTVSRVGNEISFEDFNNAVYTDTGRAFRMGDKHWVDIIHIFLEEKKQEEEIVVTDKMLEAGRREGYHYGVTNKTVESIYIAMHKASKEK
jgi:hypothetical protein